MAVTIEKHDRVWSQSYGSCVHRQLPFSAVWEECGS